MAVFIPPPDPNTPPPTSRQWLRIFVFVGIFFGVVVAMVGVSQVLRALHG
ncbi:hypothetical protein [Phenylobacterium sp.]|nr:hypothetical protein [Phenylobacterium sp.]